MTAIDILIFVEDPGAANGLMDLPGALAKHGVGATIRATGHAVEYLRSFDVAFDEAPDDAQALLADAAPGAVVTGTSENSDSLGLALIDKARKQGITSVAFVESPVSAAYRFRGHGDKPFSHAPDWILVSDEQVTAENFRNLGFPADRIVICGHPHFDRVRDYGSKLAQRGRDAVRAEVFPNAPTGAKIVAFLAELSDGLVPGAHDRNDDYTLHGRGTSNRRTDIVLEEVLDALNGADAYKVLRLHPKNTKAEFSAYRKEIDFFSQEDPALDMVFASDLVVGMTTMLLQEAVILGTPALSVVPNPEETDRLAATALGVVPVVHERESLRNLLPAALDDPALLAGKPVDEVIQFGARDRMCDFLVDLVTNTKGNK